MTVTINASVHVTLFGRLSGYSTLPKGLPQASGGGGGGGGGEEKP